jgi:hypothetical protein
MAQAGLIEDGTGRIKFVVWKSSQQRWVREGEHVRFRAAKANLHKGRWSVALTYDSWVAFPER